MSNPTFHPLQPFYHSIELKTEIELQSTVKRIREESETRARKSINLAVRAFTERGAEDGGPLSKNEAFQALDRALHQRGEELSMGEKEIQELARTQGLSPDTALAMEDAQYIRQVVSQQSIHLFSTQFDPHIVLL